MIRPNVMNTLNFNECFIGCQMFIFLKMHTLPIHDSLQHLHTQE